MADGDEKIDHNDRVLVLSRLSDAPYEGRFAGITLTWKPREVRSIQRLEAEHYVRQSRVVEDPTGTNPGVYRLVIVDQEQQPVEDGASTASLTLAEVRELSAKGFIDATYLSPDRQFGADGSMQLIDPESGQHPTRTELRGGVREAAVPQGDQLRGPDRSAIHQGLRDLAPS